MRPGTAEQQEPGSQTLQPPLKPCFPNIHLEEEFRQRGDCVRRLSTRNPGWGVGGLSTQQSSGAAQSEGTLRKTNQQEGTHRHRERPSLICMQRQQATGSEVTAQHVVSAMAGIWPQY